MISLSVTSSTRYKQEYKHNSIQIDSCTIPQLSAWLSTKGVKVSAKVNKEKVLRAVNKYIEMNFKDWKDRTCPPEAIPQQIPQQSTRTEKSQEKIDEDEAIWKMYLDYSRFQSYEKKGYRFGQSIITDGISVSIPLKCKSLHKKKQESKPSKKRKKAETNENMDLSCQQTDTIEIDEKIDYSKLKGKKIIGVDPGKYSIVYMTSDDKLKKKGKERMQISNVERHRALGMRVFQFAQQKKKKQACNKYVIEAEALLSLDSSKATSVADFQSYVRNRLDVQQKMYKYYSALMFRIL